jgi:hypothetical protein
MFEQGNLAGITSALKEFGGGPSIEHDGIYQIATFAITPTQQTESREARR